MNYYKIYRVTGGIQIENTAGKYTSTLNGNWDEFIKKTFGLVLIIV